MPSDRLATPNSRSQWYPRFSPEEYEHRWQTVREGMRENGLDALVLYGGSGAENIHYLTNYRGTYSMYFVFFADPDESPTLFVGNNNNVQSTVEMSVINDVRPMIPDPVGRVVNRINESTASIHTVGLVGLAPRYSLSLPYSHFQVLERDLDAELADATALVTTQLSIKSDEEIEWLQKAAEFTRLGMESLVETAAPGVTEYELGAAFKCAYLHKGGHAGVTYLTSASMDDPEPGACLPWRTPSHRPIEAGDVVTNEFTAKYWGYGTQIHRPIAVGRPPTDLYQELFDLAEETYTRMMDALKPGNTASDLHDALAPIENSPYKIYDVAFHGTGNGYLPPHIGTADSDYWPSVDDPITENWTFEENQILVLQPNPITADERFGLQLGNTVVIREDGPEELIDYPMEFIEV